jgi:hypothetical protein
MPRAIASTVAVMLLASAGGAVAGQPQSSTAVLQQGLQAIAQSAIAQQAQAGDPDQGDDHASDVAILTVCNHNNPSAQRSAICTQPNSPP